MALLRQVRLDAGLRQTDVAKKLGKPQSFVSNYESGERRLDLLELQVVCEVVGIKVGILLDDLRLGRQKDSTSPQRWCFRDKTLEVIWQAPIAPLTRCRCNGSETPKISASYRDAGHIDGLPTYQPSGTPDTQHRRWHPRIGWFTMRIPSRCGAIQRANTEVRRIQRANNQPRPRRCVKIDYWDPRVIMCRSLNG